MLRETAATPNTAQSSSTDAAASYPKLTGILLRMYSPEEVCVEVILPPTRVSPWIVDCRDRSITRCRSQKIEDVPQNVYPRKGAIHTPVAPFAFPLL